LRLLLPLLLLLALAELLVLIELGSRIDSLPVLGGILLGAGAGLAVLRLGGVATVLRAQQRLAAGQSPAAEILGGVLLAAGGVLLLFPGFLTDVLALPLLLSPARRWLAGRGARRFTGGVPPAAAGGDGRRHHITIEGEFERRDP
jgi:UPF0716 protein FxsA